MSVVTLKKGVSNNYVKALQYFLELNPTGTFDSDTVKAVKSYQSVKDLTADGIVGAKTYQAILEDCKTVKYGAQNKFVFMLESILQTMTLDGSFKSDEINHVKTFQTANKITADGIVGKETWSYLLGLKEVAKSGTNKQPVNYKQYDKRWKGVVYTQNGTYNKSQTIGNSGCGPTSMADIVATWWDSKVTPVQIADVAVKQGYRTKNSGTSWSFFKYVAKLYKASQFIQTSSFATMQAALNDGAYVVVSFKKSKWTNGGHYCVLWKDDGKYIYVNDPASALAARAKGTYAEVKAAAKQYFIFYK